MATRRPLARYLPACLACSPQTTTSTKSAPARCSPCRLMRPTAIRRVVTSVPLPVEWSSGSAASRPVMATRLRSMAPSLGSGAVASPGGMDEHAGGQGVGATLWPDRTKRRRSRLLTGQNVGGAQGGVLHTSIYASGEAGRLDAGLGCPLPASATMQPCGSPASTPSPARRPWHVSSQQAGADESAAPSTAGPGVLPGARSAGKTAVGRLGTGVSATGGRRLAGLGGRLGRLRGGLLVQGRLELLLAGHCGRELVSVVERPANQRPAVGGPRPRGSRGGAQLGHPGRSALDQLLKAGQDAPLLALLQPALGELERRGVPVSDPDGELERAGTPGLGGGDLDAEPTPLAQVLAGALLQRRGRGSSQRLGDGAAVGQRSATVGGEHRVPSGGVIGDGLQRPGALLAAIGVAEE